MAAGRTRCFLDVDIGDGAEFDAQSAAYARGQAYMAEAGRNYGLGTTLEDLDDAGRESIAEMYAADPSWAQRGPVRLVPPAPLRAGRLVIELYDDLTPKAAENFRKLCTGECGVLKGPNKPMHFKGVPFHRVVRGFVAQGGDYTRFDGSGGASVFGKEFKDEKEGLKLHHDRPGLLSMANGGKNSNTSQFFVTLAPAPQCDGKHVIFGHVVEGLAVVDALNAVGSASGAPTVSTVRIADCGVL
eukprot:Amastigsp_a509198_26.p1 type:complete len:243 gc:universal Amastigsp_a509198_26:937-209(-)